MSRAACFHVPGRASSLRSLLWVLVAAGCDDGGPRAPALEDPAAPYGEPADAWRRRLDEATPLERLTPGSTHLIRYAAPPIYRAYTVELQEKGPIAVGVASEGGRPVAWLLDAALRTVAYSDAGPMSDPDPLLARAGLPAGTYHVVLRDRDGTEAEMRVTSYRAEAWMSEPCLRCRVVKQRCIEAELRWQAKLGCDAQEARCLGEQGVALSGCERGQY